MAQRISPYGYLNIINDKLLYFNAGSAEQFTKGAAEIGALGEPIIDIGAGGYMKKSDKQLWITFLERSPLKKLMLNPDFAYEAFCYELMNHEFCYTNDPDDALSALGMDWDDVERKPEIMEMLKKAMRICAQE